MPLFFNVVNTYFLMLEALCYSLYEWLFGDWNFALDTLFERDKRFGRYYTGNALNPVVEQIHQLFVVFCKEFNEHSI